MQISNRKKILLACICFTIASFNYIVRAQNGSTTTDSDSDGLTNAEEKTYGTDAAKADTDGDGYSDGVEVRSGYDPLKKAPGDKLATPQTDSINVDNSALVDSLTENLQTLATSKANQEISMDDLDSVINGTLQDKVGVAPTFDTLPDIDRAKLKIKAQPYDNLSEAERKEKLHGDLQDYLRQMIGLFLSNIPDANPVEFTKKFQSELEALSSTTPDYAYFRDLAEKMQIVSDQSAQIEIPESFVDSHIKFLKILNAYIALKSDPNIPSVEDPVGSLLVLNKAQALAPLFEEFLTQFSSYLSSVKPA